jgi:hypothetical protein
MYFSCLAHCGWSTPADPAGRTEAGEEMVTAEWSAAMKSTGPESQRPRSLQSLRLPPLTRLQRVGLLGFLFVSAIDVALSAYLFFGADAAYVEANPVLAWASGGLFLFLVSVVAVKAIGAGLIAVLVSFANRFCTLAGDAVLFAALGTTTVLFLLELVTVGVAPAVPLLGFLVLPA